MSKPRVRYNPGTFSLDLMKDALKNFQWTKVNNMKRIFQYAVLVHEYEKDEANLKGGPVYKDSKIVIEPKTTLAKNEKELVFRITREIPAEYAENPDNVEILIRSF